MSKNIRGLSTSNLTVKEISFLNIGATSVTATSFSGTTATFTGTVTNNLTVNGTVTLSGSLSIPSVQLTSLSSDTSSTTDLPVLFKDANNNVVINGDYTFKPSTGELRVTKVIGNVTGQVTLTAPNDTNSNDNLVPFISGGTNQGTLSKNDGFTFDPSTGNLTATKFTGNVTGNLTGNITGNTTISGTLGVTEQITGDVTGSLNIGTNDAITLTTGVIEDGQNNAYLRLRGQTSAVGYNIGLWHDGHVRFRATSGGYRFYFYSTGPVFTQVMHIQPGQIVMEKQLIMSGSPNPNFTIRTDISENNFGTYYHNEKGHILAMGSNANNPTWRFRVYEDGAGNGVAQIYGRLVVNDVPVATTQAEHPLMVIHNDGNTNNVRSTDTAASSAITCDPTTGALTVQSLTSGNVKLTPSVPTGGTGFPILMHNGSSNDVKKSDNTCKYDAVQQVFHVKNITMDTTGEMYYKGQTLDARFGGGTTLTNGYTQIFSDSTYVTNEYNLATNHYIFGSDDTPMTRLIWYNSTSGSSAPQYMQFGQNITGGAWDFDTDDGYLALTNNAYAGNWKFRVSIVYENTTTSERHLPRVQFASTNAASTPTHTVLKQFNEGIQYARMQGGRVSTVTVEGLVNVTNTSNKFCILLSMDINNSQTFLDWTDNWNGLGVNIQCEYTGHTGAYTTTLT